MSKRSQKLVEIIKSTHQQLNANVIPQSENFANIITEFYKGEIKDFDSLITDTDKVVDQFKAKYQQCEANVHQIQQEWKKVEKFSTSGKGFLNAKAQQIKSKTKNIDAVSTGLKETVSKIKPQKLAELPVQKQKILQTLFKTLFNVLYHEKQMTFDWKTFKKLALKHEEGQDFVFRLVNINYKDLKKQDYQNLLIIKSDPEFENVCLNSVHAYDIIDVADWIEYVCVGHQFSEEKKIAEKQYDKIRKDMTKRSGGSLQMSEKFWKEALQQIDKFQNNIISLQSQLKTIKIGMQSSLDSIQQAQQWRKSQIKKTNQSL